MAATIQPLIIQTLLYETDPSALARFLSALAVTVREYGQPVGLSIGDCSARPLLTHDALDAWRHEVGENPLVTATYTVFGDNLGFAKGHNRLRREAPSASRLLILNPDSLPAPHLLTRMVRLADERPDAGAIEARQIPIEHPKLFDMQTWLTDWVSGACTLLDGAAFDRVSGFDEAFFMYAEDVDLSWRLRAVGARLYFCPETFIYHAKRLANGQPVISPAEAYFGPLGLMLLRAKYGRADLNARTLELLRADPRPECARTLADYHRLLPTLRPTTLRERAFAEFQANGDLADQRWKYPLPGQMMKAQ